MTNSGISILSETVVATAPILQRHFIGFNGTYPNAGESAMGIVHIDAAIDEHCSVVTMGIHTVTSGSAFTIGDALEVGTDGKAIKKDSGTTVARSRGIATDADQIVEVFLVPN